MSKRGSNHAWRRLTRCLALIAAPALLAGCAAPYAFVQPDMAGSGGYYTGDGPYSGQGYYDYYGTGPYYPGTSGYGYYNGSSPYWDPFAYRGGYYGGYGYGSSIGFNVGISNVWGFPGYWGPWYTTSWRYYDRCRHDHCDGHHDDHHGHGGHDGGTAPVDKPDRRPDLPREVAHRTGGDGPPPVAVRSLPRTGLPGAGRVTGRPSETMPRFVRAPVRAMAGGRAIEAQARPPRGWTGTAGPGVRQSLPPPRATSAPMRSMSRPVPRAAPMPAPAMRSPRVTHVAPPPPPARKARPSRSTPATKIR